MDRLSQLSTPRHTGCNLKSLVSQRGGQGAAVLYSLVSSAKASGVEPFAWLRDLFTRLPYYREGEAFTQAAADQPVTSAELSESAMSELTEKIQLLPEERSLILKHGYLFERLEHQLRRWSTSPAIKRISLSEWELSMLIGELRTCWAPTRKP